MYELAKIGLEKDKSIRPSSSCLLEDSAARVKVLMEFNSKMKGVYDQC